MRSRYLLNIALLLILAILVMLVVFEPGKHVEPPPELITSLKPQAIQQIRLHTPRIADMELEKQGTQWLIRSPLQARANNARIENILAITEAVSLTRYPLSGLDLAQLGLADPHYTLQLDQVELRFGGTESLQLNRYLQLADRVHLINDRYSYLLQGSAEDFIDPQLLTAGETLQALSLPTVELRLANTQWQVVGSPEQPSADRINTLVDNWRHARAARVTPLQQPASGDTIRIELGNTARPLVYVLSRTDNEIILSQPELALSYHFPLSSGEALLNLPPPPTSNE